MENSQARKKLEKIYGKRCFFEMAHCEERIEQIGNIPTFRKFKEEKRYHGKKISLQLTYHHLRHVSENGKTTLENGAVVSEIAHQYLHSLPRAQEEVVNNMLREFKTSVNVVCMTPSENSFQAGENTSLDFDFENGFIEIQAYDTKPKDRKKLEEYNRAKVKRETMKLADSALYEK